MKEEAKLPPAIIKRERVVLEGLEPKSLVRSASAQPCGKKSVRFVEHEGRPRAIEFTCGCGEATLVELVFENQPATATAKVGVKS
jgi:hypothetical protein